MKKTVVLLLLLIYGSATIGATVHMHYCMNELVGWSLLDNEKEKECVKCGMKEKKGGCCKDKQQQVKLNTDHQKTTTAQYFTILDAPTLINLVDHLGFVLTKTAQAFPIAKAPPKIPKERLYVLHSVFLI